MDEISKEFGKGQKEANLFLCIAFAIVGLSMAHVREIGCEISRRKGREIAHFSAPNPLPKAAGPV